jgi:hypothetical protein
VGVLGVILFLRRKGRRGKNAKLMTSLGKNGKQIQNKLQRALI